LEVVVVDLHLLDKEEVYLDRLVEQVRQEFLDQLDQLELLISTLLWVMQAL
jgi:hypothetical protein